jgi:UDPglucose 6-dehydrogenase
MNVTVVGSGYVGLVAGACFAENGNDVICVDIDKAKIEALNRGEIPIYEPGLSDLITRNVKTSRLKFTTSLKDGVEASEVIFIAVGTPQDEDGAADLTHVLNVAKGIGTHMNGPKIVVDKSTVPVGTAKKVRDAITALTKHPVHVVSNPEFLKEGAAIEDFMKPDRVVIGVDSDEAARVMKDLYAPFVRTNNPILIMDVVSAEMTKYAANTMLAVRVSFMNEIANLCEKVGADIDQVRIGIGTDSRIGMSFLFPGMGYGGSCFPKDVQALIKTGIDFGTKLKLAIATEEVNRFQKTTMTSKILAHFGKENVKGKVFAVWGLAFKPRTDDVREAPALVLCKELLELGATIQAYDPEAMDTFEQKLGESPNLVYTKTNYDALKMVDALVICTEWNEFRNPNFNRIKDLMRNKVIFDGRNIFDREEMKELGFVYYSVGRPSVNVGSR